ncbi:MAG: IS21 family transposase [Gemmatimonadetes bacterium]|nr:IS21 family transposase [Gemmatimonadota bacterium]
MLLTHLLEQGLTKTAIAAQVGVSRRTVYHWLATGQLDRDLSQGGSGTRVQRPAKLDPYKPIIDTRLGTYPQLSAVRLFTEVQAAGYAGGITQLRDYVLQVRPRPEPEPVVRFETPPGLQAQVDFADFRFPWGKRHALLVVLGHSRLLWLTFYLRQTMRTLMTGLETAFAYLGGVPRELLFDQLKAVIIEDRRPDDGKLIENPEFLRFAAHWGFRIRACRPYRAQTKGKVERPVSYVRGNFVYGREFLGDADLAAQAARWLDDVANVRCHGTTGEAPRLRFERDERAVLLPLAARPYQPLVPLVPRRAPIRAAALDFSVERRPLESYSALLEAI